MYVCVRVCRHALLPCPMALDGARQEFIAVETRAGATPPECIKSGAGALRSLPILIVSPEGRRVSTLTTLYKEP